jgi:hypothetical protein
MTGWSKIWALKKSLNTPRASIAKAYRPGDRLRPPVWRCPGTAVPGLYLAGTFYNRGRKEFWSTRFQGTVGLELRDAEYAGIVVDVEDPDQIAAALGQGVR